MWNDPEHKVKVSESLRKLMTPERKARAAETTRLLMSDPEHALRVTQGLLNYWSDPDARTKHALKMKQVAATPEWRTAVSEATKSALSNIGEEGRERRSKSTSRKNSENWADKEKREELCKNMRKPKNLSVEQKIRLSVRVCTDQARISGRPFSEVNFK